MRRALAVLAVLAALSMPAFAQEATVDSPTTRSAVAKYRVEIIQIVRSPLAVNILLSSRAADESEINRVGVQIPPDIGSPCTATFGGFLNAFDAPAAGEPAGLNRFNYRVLAYLQAQTCFPVPTTVNQ